MPFTTVGEVEDGPKPICEAPRKTGLPRKPRLRKASHCASQIETPGTPLNFLWKIQLRKYAVEFYGGGIVCQSGFDLGLEIAEVNSFVINVDIHSPAF
jgi:hypothetical protein